MHCGMESAYKNRSNLSHFGLELGVAGLWVHGGAELAQRNTKKEISDLGLELGVEGL